MKFANLLEDAFRLVTRINDKRLCVKVASIRSERGLQGHAPFLLDVLVKRSQTTLHTASNRFECLRTGIEITIFLKYTNRYTSYNRRQFFIRLGHRVSSFSFLLEIWNTL